MKQYEIWWANLPAPAGRRPVLLLSRDSAYEYLNKFVVVEITTTVRSIAEEVPLGRLGGPAETVRGQLRQLADPSTLGARQEGRGARCGATPRGEARCRARLGLE